MEPRRTRASTDQWCLHTTADTAHQHNVRLFFRFAPTPVPTEVGGRGFEPVVPAQNFQQLPPHLAQLQKAPDTGALILLLPSSGAKRISLKLQRG